MKIFRLVLQRVPFLDTKHCRARDIIGRQEAMMSSALRCATPHKKIRVCTTLTNVLRLAKITIVISHSVRSYLILYAIHLLITHSHLLIILNPLIIRRYPDNVII